MPEACGRCQQVTFDLGGIDVGRFAWDKKLTGAECPLLADRVEEVGALAVLGGARRQARRSLFAIRSESGRAAGPALPAFGDSGRWQPAGTRLEHQMDLSA